MILQKIGAVIVGVAMTIGGWLGYVPEQNLGGSTQSTDVIALFETTLASKITDSATTFTLTSATDKDGTTLASSTYGFIIDEGTASEEFVIADCTATACTNALRGVSVKTGTTTAEALRFAHRRGSSVKITDAPSLIYAINVMRGKQNLDRVMRYGSNFTFTNDGDIISKKYVDDTAFSGAGVIDASTVARGVVELATGLETASSTSSGGSGVLVVPASVATSTYNSATAALKVVVTQNSGKIDENFISTTTLFANASLLGSPYVAGYATTTDYQIFTASSTWSKPLGAKWIKVMCWGGGGGGGSNNNTYGGGGGGGGAFVEGMFASTSLPSTVNITIGAGGIGGAQYNDGEAGGNTTFGSYLTAYGGGGGGGTGAAVKRGGGGGGGTFGAGTNASGAAVGLGGSIASTTYGGGDGKNGGQATWVNSIYGGGGGGNGGSNDATAGGFSYYGGGGGGGGNNGGSVGASGGNSVLGGDGGAGGGSNQASNGNQPGGGGGGNRDGDGADGGAGQCIITTFF